MSKADATMSAVPRTIRPFFISLACSWLGLLAAAAVYSKQHPLSHWITTAALPAFLVEAVLYLGTLFEAPRLWFSRVGTPKMQAALLWIAALVPYLVFSLVAGTFNPNAFYLLSLLVGVLAFWYAVLPKRFAYDAGFLIIAAVPLITGVFKRIYNSPDSLQMDILGHLMWIRLGVAALLVLRKWDPGEFGLWPRAREWRVGLMWFAIAVVPLIGAGLALGDVHYAPIHTTWWVAAGKALGYFFGALWVIALPEELFFRGIIEKAILQAWRSPAIAVTISAVLYASAHLWYHAFPNWRHPLVVVVLGVACGIAYLQTKSVRAPMVTHACAVVTWRMFFS